MDVEKRFRVSEIGEFRRVLYCRGIFVQECNTARKICRWLFLFLICVFCGPMVVVEALMARVMAAVG